MEKVWYYMAAGTRRKYGPYDDQEIAALIHQEILLANDYIWMPDMKNWVKVGNSIYSVFLPENRHDIENTIS